jgi:hypothetical protein
MLKLSTDTKADYWQMIYLTCVSDGVAAVKNSSEAQRAEIIRRFNEAGAEERREGYDLMAAKSRSEDTKVSALVSTDRFPEAVSTLGSPAEELSRKDADTASNYLQDEFEAYVERSSVRAPAK